MTNARNTRQKLLIAEAVRACPHATASAVYETVRASLPRISLGTVYRVLNGMVRDGALYRVTFADGEDVYDTNEPSHAHIRCRVCGRVADVFLPLPTVGSVEGFTVEQTLLEFSGICDTCRARENKI